MKISAFYGKSKLFFSFILCLLTGIVCAVPNEYADKANHLYQFVKHVQWPQTKVLNICVVGANPLANQLKQLVQGQTVGGRDLHTKPASPTQSVAGCHLLFVSKSLSNQQVKAILQSASPSALTVGEQTDFIRLGGIINFIIQNNKVRYEVNYSLAKQRGLKLGYQLVKHASKRH